MNAGNKTGGVGPARVLVVPLQQTTDPFWARTDDVGRRGVFIRSTRLLPADSTCLLKIQVEGRSAPLWARATVVHHIPGMGFGCTFSQLSPENHARLEAWLGRRDVTPSRPVARPQRRTDRL